MKKLCISEIHLGRYCLEFLDENNQVTAATDGGSALIMMWLTDWIFKREHTQYIKDQRKSSDEIGAAAIMDILASAPPGAAEALAKLEAKRANRFTKALTSFIEDLSKNKTHR